MVKAALRYAVPLAVVAILAYAGVVTIEQGEASALAKSVAYLGAPIPLVVPRFVGWIVSALKTLCPGALVMLALSMAVSVWQEHRRRQRMAAIREQLRDFGPGHQIWAASDEEHAQQIGEWLKQYVGTESEEEKE